MGHSLCIFRFPKIILLNHLNSLLLPKYITLIYNSGTSFSSKEVEEIKDANIKLLENPIINIDLAANCIRTSHSGKAQTFDTLYSAMGCKKNNELAINLGAKAIKGGLVVNEHQETSVQGLYAVGDIIKGLNQICVAEGEGALAAMDIHNRCKNDKQVNF